MTGRIIASLLGFQDPTATPLPELKEVADEAAKQPSISLSQWIWAGVIMAIGIGIGTLLRRAIRSLTKPGADNEAAVQITAQLVFVSTGLVAAYVALIVLGVNLTPLLAGAGIASVVLGFALQDITENYVSGIIIGFSHPFNPGDELVIQDGELEGTIEELQLRYTVIRSHDGIQVMIPNSRVLKAPIKNLTTNPHRRSELLVRAGLHEDMKRVIEVAKTALVDVEDVADDPAPDAYVEQVTENWTHVIVRFWHKSERELEHKAVSDATIAVNEALADAGIETPYKSERPEPESGG